LPVASSIVARSSRWALPSIVLLAGAMQASVFGTAWAAGWLHIEGFVWQTHTPREIVLSFLSVTVVFALVGWYEELLARGYWLQNLSEGLNRPLAVLVSSSVFAVGHAGNPNVTWVALLGLVGAGLLLAWAYLRTGRLWLAMGIHFGWNFFEGPVFGFPVSGVETMPLLEITVSGPALWTGGQFGPEAGLVLLPALALSALAIGLATRGRGLRASVAVD
jgi:membrane protease YdiL (CAAX protease family)